MIRTTTIALLILTVLASCERQTPEVINGDPVFTINGMIGGEELEIIAGEDDYYMYTSYEMDANNMYVFQGGLKKQQGNGAEFFIDFNDKDVTSSNKVCHVEEAITVGNGVYNQPVMEDEFISVKYNADYWLKNAGDEIYFEWTDANNRLFVGQQAEVLYPQGEFPIDMHLLLVNKDEKTETRCRRTIYFENPCEVDFTYSRWYDEINFQRYLTFSVINPDPSKQYEWDFPVANDGNEATHNYEYDLGQQGIDDVTLISSQGDDCTYMYKRYFIVDSNLTNALVNIDYTTERVMVPRQTGLPFSQINLTYVDENGVTYKSNLGAQSSDAYFEILNVVEYDVNENGEHTKKMEVTFTCDLFAEDGSSMRATEVHANLGIAYPSSE